MHVYSIDQCLEVSLGASVVKRGDDFYLDFCGQITKKIKDLLESDTENGRVYKLFADINYKSKQANFNRCFAQKMSGVILFLEHLHFVKSQTILGKRFWIQSTKDLGGECGFLVLNFDSTGVIALQIEGEIFLFGELHPGITCSMSAEEFSVHQRNSKREDNPREYLASQVNWILLEESQNRISKQEGTLAPLLKKALGK